MDERSGSYYKDKKISADDLLFAACTYRDQNGALLLWQDIPIDESDVLHKGGDGKQDIDWVKVELICKEYIELRGETRVDSVGYVLLRDINEIRKELKHTEKKYLKSPEPDEDVKFDEESLSKVVISNKAKNDIIETVNQVKYASLLFDKWDMFGGQNRGRGVNMLFYGIPGSGKTYCSEVIASYLGKEVEFVSMASVKSKWVGDSEKNIKNMLSGIKNKVVIIDEVDSIATSRDDVNQDHGVNLINEFLVWLERHHGVVIMTTNRIDKLDPAFRRRLDLEVEFKMPNAEQRKAIWDIMLDNKMPKEYIDTNRLAVEEMTGSEIKNVVKSCARKLAFDIKVANKDTKLTENMLLVAISNRKRGATVS